MPPAIPNKPAEGPPKGFRPHMPLKVKLESLVIHGNRDKETGEKFGKIGNIDFDHDPPIQLRVWDRETQDTDPAANDPEYIVPRLRTAHRRKTATKDIPAIGKTKRIARTQNERHERALNGGENVPATGSFKSKIRSRNSFKRHAANSKDINEDMR